jgi:hypothetical protein
LLVVARVERPDDRWGKRPETVSRVLAIKSE